MLTAKTLCRSALVALESLRNTTKPEAWPDGAYRWAGPVAALYGLELYIGDDDLQMDLDRFCETRLIPAVAAWAQDFPGVELRPEYLMLPMGMKGADNERYSGIAMRCIISQDHPVGNRNVPSRMTRYYDVANDEFKEEPCSMMISFWVHGELGDPWRYAHDQGEDMRKLAKVR